MADKTIVFIRSNPVNPDSRVEKEVVSLHENNFAIIILAWDRDNNYREVMEEFYVNKEIRIFKIGLKATFGEGMKNIVPFLKFQVFILKWLIINKNKYSYIHACDFDTGFTAMVSTIFTKRKLVFDIFDYLSTNPIGIFKRLLRRMENSIINNADAVIICNDERKQQIKKTNPKKLYVIHNTPPLYKALNTETNVMNDVAKIVYVGILQDYRLIKEMVDVIAKKKDCELHIAGFGKYHEYLKQQAAVHKNIIYYGKITYQETLKLENKSDLMTAIYDPSIGNHKYAAPNKFYEALMLGKPLIMVKNTGMSKIVEDNKLGVCIDFSKEGFEKGLEELMKMKSEWEEIGLKEKKLYEKMYSWDIMEKRLIDLYMHL